MKEAFVKEKYKEYNAYCACSIPPEGKTSEEYEAEYEEIYNTFEELFEKELTTESAWRDHSSG